MSIDDHSKHSVPQYEDLTDSPPVTNADLPAGFEPLFRSSPFLDHLGPFFMRKDADGAFVIGLRVLPCHANGRGNAHGGLLMTLCDIALGYRTSTSVDPRPFLTTASVTTDFAGSAKVGDWIEAHVDVQKVGRTLAFANCYVVCDGQRIVHASAIFTVLKAERPA
jgi:uncharacterized protein (TIGR00369 family)